MDSARAPVSRAADDALRLLNARITNAVKCLPPDNKPLPIEAKTCNDYLSAELAQSTGARVILALGAIAHLAVLRAEKLAPSQYKFAHAAEHAISGGKILLNSYHCSRYNTQTRRLTTPMFEGGRGARARAHWVMSFDAKVFVDSLPGRPGVYRMLGEEGEILYVGKARNLKNRVGSYFQPSNVQPKVHALVAKTANMEVTITNSEIEALLLEYNLNQEAPPALQCGAAR